jgi:hypothetical protein
MCLVAGWSPFAVGSTIILEEEPNNSFDQAQLVPPYVGFSVIHGSITPGDVDFFEFEIVVPTIFEAVVYSFPNFTPVPQARLELYDSSGAVLATAEAGTGATWAYISDISVMPGTTYVLGLTGAGDVSFTGDHAQQFNYTMHWFIPTPGTAAVLFAAAGLLRRRRRA